MANAMAIGSTAISIVILCTESCVGQHTKEVTNTYISTNGLVMIVSWRNVGFHVEREYNLKDTNFFIR